MTNAGVLPIPPNLNPTSCDSASHPEEPEVSSALTTQSALRILQVAHTPDPDDAFAWFALAEKRLGLQKFQLEITTPHIDLINERCIHEDFYDVAAISLAAYPFMQENYRILSAGASVGRGYGPGFMTSKSALVGMTASEAIEKGIFKNWTIAISGEHTTAAALIKNQQATEYAYQFSNDPKSEEVDEYIHRFANEDTLELPDDYLDAPRLFWKKTCELGNYPEVSGFAVVTD